MSSSFPIGSSKHGPPEVQKNPLKANLPVFAPSLPWRKRSGTDAVWHLSEKTDLWILACRKTTTAGTVLSSFDIDMIKLFTFYFQCFMRVYLF